MSARTPIEATPLSATSAVLGSGLRLGLGRLSTRTGFTSRTQVSGRKCNENNNNE